MSFLPKTPVLDFWSPEIAQPEGSGSELAGGSWEILWSIGSGNRIPLETLGLSKLFYSGGPRSG